MFISDNFKKLLTRPISVHFIQLLQTFGEKKPKIMYFSEIVMNCDNGGTNLVHFSDGKNIYATGIN